MKNIFTANATKLYVGTYGKYAAGSIDGAWLTLNDYDTLEDFLEACKELHKDEQDPEFMFQDCEGPTFGMYSECSVSPELFKACKAMDLAAANGYEADAMEAFLELRQRDLEDYEDADEILDEFQEAYFGHFDDDYDLGYYCATECGRLDIPEDLEPYFDYEKYGRDCSFDFSELNGYYFAA